MGLAAVRANQCYEGVGAWDAEDDGDEPGDYCQREAFEPEDTAYAPAAGAHRAQDADLAAPLKHRGCQSVEQAQDTDQGYDGCYGVQDEVDDLELGQVAILVLLGCRYGGRQIGFAQGCVKGVLNGVAGHFDGGEAEDADQDAQDD